MINSATVKEIVRILAPGDRVYCRVDGPVTAWTVIRILPDGVLTPEGELLFRDYRHIWWLTPIAAAERRAL